ncbi:ribosome-associated translation inhibitor RaiA [Paralimibaculum aggregatum]|uniref:Ribosome hibernation promoting factor n=1 Tax=Paralimibaculum aggregatum TaxID=3036245 RepID=A0ABQ6LRA4_9RHOB|nr:ribosome-associated translation inhibitor RaiA [Limibaculum sp. NKW23]GMG84892.1 ribosome-associated translation inhibitor RaiA [Limibaculum sp. NKW23]
MHTKISGKHIDIGDALRTHVEDRLNEAAFKYFDRPVDAAVVFSRDGHGYKCDSSVHLPTGLTAKAQGSHGEIYAAFEASAERIEKQLRRHKRRLKDHHQRRENPIEAIEAQAYVLARHEDEAEETGAGDHGAEAEGANGAENGLQPVIVAEMKTDIQTLSVGEAVLQMELAHAPFLMFKNDANGRLNIVFQRDDGNIGWVDPAIVADN